MCSHWNDYELKEISMKKNAVSWGLGTILFTLFISQSCQQYPDPKEEAEALLELDRQFSMHSEQFGANHAFMDYIDDDAVLLRSNRYPVEGRKKIEELYSRPDTGLVLTWEPSFAYVSNGGDLGYTYGIYKMECLTPDGELDINKGTYVTIWRKDSTGNWKFVLDTGNPGLERKKPDLE
jgi:ketosteroid isomerase-like protein